MKKWLFLLFFLPVMLSAQQDKDIQTVQGLLRQQQADWNRADIEAFMEVYWKSEDLQFAGSNGIIFGWQNTLERYKRNYPDADAMGKLTFDISKVRKIDPKIILLNGKFTLERKNDQPSGYFTLIWKKMKGEWVIIADHTS
jgi:hypothetical protein